MIAKEKPKQVHEFKISSQESFNAWNEQSSIKGSEDEKKKE